MSRKFIGVWVCALVGALFVTGTPARAAGAGAWQAPATLRQPQYYGAVTALADGSVLVAGGIFNDNTTLRDLDTAEVYDPTTRTWTALPKMSSQRDQPGAVRLADGGVLVVGGHYSDDGHNYPIRYTSEIFDPATRTWSAPEAMPDDFEYLGDTATLPNGKSYFLGFNARAYDPADGSWSMLPRADFGVWATSALADGRLLGVGWGGITGVFDTNTNTWTRAGDYPNFIQEHQSVLLPDGRLFMTTYTGGSSDDQAAAIFDPAANAWTPVPATAQPFPGASVALLPNGDVLVAGGYRISTTTVTAGASEYAPATNSWTQLASLPAPRNVAGTVALGDGVLLVGGGNQDSVSYGDSIEFALPNFANGEFAVTDASVNEGGLLDPGSLTFTAHLAHPAAKPVHLHATTANGTASGDDYSGGTFDVTIKKGDTTGTITVPVRGDLFNEPDETLYLDVVDPRTNKAARAVGVIRNDDPNLLGAIGL